MLIAVLDSHADNAEGIVLTAVLDSHADNAEGIVLTAVLEVTPTMLKG